MKLSRLIMLGSAAMFAVSTTSIFFTITDRSTGIRAVRCFASVGCVRKSKAGRFI